MRILLAEDDANMITVMRRIIQPVAGGAIVEQTSCLADLLRIVRDDPPDLVILDLKLADAEPAETLSHMKEIGSRSDVIVVTGNVTDSPNPKHIPKDENLFKRLTAAIAALLLSRPGGAWDRADKSLKRLREISELQNGPGR